MGELAFLMVLLWGVGEAVLFLKKSDLFLSDAAASSAAASSMPEAVYTADASSTAEAVSTTVEVLSTFV
ncbi:hypothetical protein X471_00765 [Bartonella bacilliformis str. Heidi Mejia]|uniref:hypothetical protein n=1 Tax=Bartonella bacilliformis TaxID=774 RepID=UPI00044EA822|nr:hypothetical protein [Bartonella bacilliformis]EYS91595.1 hypothetical protein X471_00765 [Bartonella bacilliformis str. Heidi Mejia]KEG16112.1 hypothetical protein H707_01261 [Bartonella bacilliformis Hosp800-02]KEG19837.1 hypothetical protein H707_00190 [Bartonella bacilliformis Hosp800-02]KEG24853.1 hypothetical protein H708_00192 [Bartonella bacilliformis VAB9028]KEG24879.1 hypothetical protein H706_00193 [Bartonella bacilliformis CAR600-02]